MAYRLVAACVLALCGSLSAQDAVVHLKSGADSLQRGNLDQAIRECKAALAADPQYAAAHMLLGQAYLAQHSVSMIAEAKAELQQALDLDPNLFWGRFYLAKIYTDLGLNEKAREQLRRGLKDQPDVPHFLSLLGEVERKLGKPETSIDLNRKALARDPNLAPAARYYIGLALLDLHEEDEAAAEIESSLASPYVVPEMYLTLASLYRRRGRLNDAEGLAKKAVALDATRPEAYLELARIYNAQGSSEKALPALKLALPEGKELPATAYYQQIEADTYFELGRAYQAKKMKPQAVDAYSRSLELDPGRDEARSRLEKLGSTGSVRLVK